MSSTETGVIFGNIVYETSNVHERTVVVLNDIHIDIMDYISPAVCSDAAFRTMWAEFEWENKVFLVLFFSTYSLNLISSLNSNRLQLNYPGVGSDPDSLLSFFKLNAYFPLNELS